MESRDAVTLQAEFAAVVVGQILWRGGPVTEAALLDALGMSGLVLAEHAQSDDLNPASVAAVLMAIDDVEPERMDARIFDLDSYRATTAV